MADGTKIEWTDATVNAINGCTVVSPGCTNCYAMRLAGTRMKNHPTREGLTVESKAGPVWTGEVRLNKLALVQPLGWKKPRRIFWNAHGDMFHPSVPDWWIDWCFAVMAMTPQHIHQVLTKRADRMRAYLEREDKVGDWLDRMDEIEDGGSKRFSAFPLPNVWLGVSAENQHWLMQRAPHLVETPAAVRFLSIEPCLSRLDIEPFVLPVRQWSNMWANNYPLRYPKHRVDWVIAGGESGPGSRPMPLDVARSLRDQCAAAGVPFFFKQWGQYLPSGQMMADGRFWQTHSGQPLHAIKSMTGRYLDGVLHDAMPEAAI